MSQYKCSICGGERYPFGINTYMGSSNARSGRCPKCFEKSSFGKVDLEKPLPPSNPYPPNEVLKEVNPVAYENRMRIFQDEVVKYNEEMKKYEQDLETYNKTHPTLERVVSDIFYELGIK